MTEVRRRGRPASRSLPRKKAHRRWREDRDIAIPEKSGGSSSVSDISLNLDLPLSTTFRLLKVLEGADFVYQDSQLGWWHIGLGAFNIGSAYIHNRDVLSVGGPFMRRLMLMSGETVNVAIRNGNEAVLIGQQECKSMVRMCAPLGSRLPLHASGAGKALLYPLPAEELVDVIVKTGLQRFTPTTIVDLPVLQRNLDEARACGYSIDREEHVTGLNCIASAVYDDVGSVVAAISISGPASKANPGPFCQPGRAGKETARNISTALALNPCRLIADPTRSLERDFLIMFKFGKIFPIK